MSESLPRSWNCTWCGKVHEYGLWYAAHCSESLTHHCDNCGADHITRNYKQRRVKAGKKELKLKGSARA